MTSHAPKITPAVRETSHLQTAALVDPVHRKALDTLHEIVRSCRGPHGALKVLHNDIGGHATLTSSSGRLWGCLSFKNPLLKLMRSCIQGHLDAYSDGGLFAAGWALSLIHNGLQLDLHPRLLTDVYEFLLREVLQGVKSKVGQETTDSSSWLISLDTSSLQDMSAIIQTVVLSKPGCSLWPGEMEHLSSLILTAYLRTAIEGATRDTCQYLCIEGMPSSSSYISEGLLLLMPSIPVYRTKPLQIPQKEGRILVAAFNVSMSGDTSEGIDTDYVVTGPCDVDDVILEKMMSCVDCLMKLGVGVVVCQRVIHPSVKKRLRQNHVLVIDRLGIQFIYTLHQLTGGSLLGSFTTTITQDDLGQLDHVQHLVIERKSYLHLRRAQSPVCTVVLHGRSEEALAELKHTCMTARHVLQMAMRQPLAVAGGGCWQTCLAGDLVTKAQKNISQWCEELGCSKRQLQIVTEAFCSSLMNSVAVDTSHDHMTDSAYHHRWLMPQSSVPSDIPTSCVCGAVKTTEDISLSYMREALSWDSPVVGSPVGDMDRPKLLDSYAASVNALKIGVATAVMILGIHNVIEDVN